MDDILIAAENLCRDYGALRAIDQVNLTLKRGEVLGFLGPNGAGKSTTMRILSGALAPTTGSIRIVGHDLLESPRAAKSRIGYLPEHPPLYRELTVDEYLHHCARLRRMKDSAAREAVVRVKSRCGLNDVGHRLLGNLSKGYQQRAGIAQAIIHSPAVVILDEPTVGLDPIQIREIRALIRELRADHGVILSTHILPEVQTVCDRVLIIHEGRIVLNSTIDQLAGDTGWRVGFARPPSIEKLKTVPKIQNVTAVDASHFRFEGSEDAVTGLLRLSLEENWGLIELTRHSRTLEEIFVQLTHGEQPAGDASS
ncbi:MAG TPA: ATP-binding cassette domain-containing protein [Gammaproteobacteria bacterium]|nr:ATP-binding cassette domain-containing protein [Gammaproteobacteria bacterium]